MFRFPMTLGRRLTLVLVSFFILMLVVVAGLVVYLRGDYLRSIYSLGNANAGNIMTRADSVFDDAMLLGDLFVADEFFQSRLSEMKDNPGTSDSAARNEIVSRLSTMQDTSIYITDVALMTDVGILHYGEGVGLSSEALARAAEMALDAGGGIVWVGSDGGSVYLVREIRRVENLSLDSLAVLFIRIDTALLMADIRSGMSDAGISLILFSGDHLLYSDYPHSQAFPDDSDRTADVGGTPCFIFRGTLAESGFHFLDFVPVESTGYGIDKAVAGAFFIFLLILLIFLIILHFMVRRIIARIERLRGKMDTFEKGNYIAPSPVSGGDEISSLDRHFDMMASGYKKVVEDNYIKQIMLKDSSIRMLTQQINPHFLYNVLDSVYWLAESRGDEDIAQMSYDLAALFRMAVSEEDMIPLSRELELADSYMRIQSCRYPGRIDYSVSVPDALMDVMVPKFSIQPLAENAVIHSLEVSGGAVSVYVSASSLEREGKVSVTVSNTGSSFPDGLLEKLHSGEIVSSGTRIGLLNIDERLRLLFGDGYGLSFTNEGGMASVSFSVPGEVGCSERS